jgi:hypothetical protein
VILTSPRRSGATLNLATATFDVNVAPPANTAPAISVGGVDPGASYNQGAVPTATCLVTDAEDGNSSFAATLSAVWTANGFYAPVDMGAGLPVSSSRTGRHPPARAPATRRR